ncbi:MAG: hypothetical protein M1830_006433 [Pleopsidium flavum]|nr:MAG: hypothetical protein M1830_006433 [Pleopsidium flavum]
MGADVEIYNPKVALTLLLSLRHLSAPSTHTKLKLCILFAITRVTSTTKRAPASGEGKRPSFGAQTIVNVIVGSEKRNFGIHKDLLKHHSTYFDAALTGTFKESQEGLVLLPEDSPDVFELFVNWLYTQAFFWGKEDTEDLMTWRNLVQLYVFADLRGVSTLKNLVIDAISGGYLQKITYRPYDLMHEVPWIYQNTVKTSPLRRLLVDWFVWDTFPIERLIPIKDDLNIEYVLDVAQGLQDRVRDQSTLGPWQIGSCYYHDHATGKLCRS